MFVAAQFSRGDAFVVAPSRAAVAIRSLGMVRNIDLPEAVILYGIDVICDPAVADTAREGLCGLLQECHEVQTAVIVLLESESTKQAREFLETVLPETVAGPCHVRLQTEAPPNPVDLLSAIESIAIQPRAFGGSSGFGSKPADPERFIEPKHCVVLTSTVDQTRAARSTGMRVISVEQSDELADAVLFQDEIDFWLDDIATPGSFWLNPPHPRDDQGNKVDPYTMVDVYKRRGAADSAAGEETSDLDDDEFKAILADLAPL
jgi:hypothetical protein